METTSPTPSIVVVKTITVTWDEDRQGEGRLYARCDEDRTLSSDTVRWDEPITVQTDAWEIAFAVTEINGAEILSVDHDGDTVCVSVDGSVCEIDDNDDRDDVRMTATTDEGADVIRQTMQAARSILALKG